jgi:hypothetical protein
VWPRHVAPSSCLSTANQRIVDPPPRYEDALAEFRSFLRQRGSDLQAIQWIFAGQVRWWMSTAWIDLSSMPSNEDAVRRIYDRCTESRSRIRLEHLCSDGSTAVCYIWTSRDQLDDMWAELCHQPPGSLALSRHMDVVTKLVRHPGAWQMLNAVCATSTAVRALWYSPFIWAARRRNIPFHRIYPAARSDAARPRPWPMTPRLSRENP